MSISMRVSDKEKKIIKQIADLYGMTLSEYIRTVVMEKIEDEYDLKCAEEALKEYESDHTIYTLEEVAQHLGIED